MLTITIPSFSQKNASQKRIQVRAKVIIKIPFNSQSVWDNLPKLNIPEATNIISSNR